MKLTGEIGRRWYEIKASRAGNVALALILSLLVFSGCLGLKSHKRQPNNDAKNCAGVSCWEPPSNTCTTDDALQVYAPSGYCSGGECSYATRQEQCHSGICDEGECVNTPCQGLFCYDPPEPICVDRNRKIYAPSGYCSGGKCSYASKISDCDYLCESGSCTDSPCAEVFCPKSPAPYCQDDKSLVVFELEGRCTVVEDQPKCLHESQTIACDYGCKGGRCQDNPCVGVVCARPPARYCDGAELVLFEPYGVCNQRGFCSYTEQRKPCIEPCVDAHCGEDPPCTSECNEPPASYCVNDAQLRVYDRIGWCENGFCSYLYSDNKCRGGCADGRCKHDPCAWKPCDRPPAAYCSGDVLISFDQEGTCDESNGTCIYPQNGLTCSDGCENVACLTGSDTDPDTNMDTDTDTDIEVDTETNADCINGAEASGTEGIIWVTICGGTFNMGSTTGNSSEQPAHSVTVKTFEMLETEVTVAQYGACVTEGSCTEPGSGEPEDNWRVVGRENHPVNTVDWNQAVVFCEWAGGRLPSEAEWEYAASNGSAENFYPWGDEMATCSYAVMDDGVAGCGMNRTWDVCLKTAGNTSHGLCDMTGNVSEWVQDWYHDDYTDAPDDGSAWEDPIGLGRVFRGGAFVTSADFLRAAERSLFPPEIQFNAIGFRCAR